MVQKVAAMDLHAPAASSAHEAGACQVSTGITARLGSTASTSSSPGSATLPTAFRKSGLRRGSSPTSVRRGSQGRGLDAAQAQTCHVPPQQHKGECAQARRTSPFGSAGILPKSAIRRNAHRLVTGIEAGCRYRCGRYRNRAASVPPSTGRRRRVHAVRAGCQRQPWCRAPAAYAA